MKAKKPNHWITREFPRFIPFYYYARVSHLDYHAIINAGELAAMETLN